jgi:hypothetical protein
LVRSNGTYQSIGQKLSEGDTLKAGKNYKLNVYLAYSKHYKLKSTTDKSIPYNKPAIFRAWGYNSVTNKEELLGETPLIENKQWKMFEFYLKPRLQSSDTIIFEAHYDAYNDKNYDGNILIDNISTIIEATPRYKRKYK